MNGGPVARRLARDRTVLVAAHGNSLRALVKHLDQISDEAIAKLNIPTGIPLRYDLDEDHLGVPVVHSLMGVDALGHERFAVVGHDVLDFRDGQYG